MVLFDGFAGLVFLALWLFCIIDVITTPEERCRNLPKMIWLLIVIFIPDIGSIAWLVAGHTWDGAPRQNAPSRAPRSKPLPSNPDDDDEFLANLRARADEQRRRAREAQSGSEDDAGPKA